MGRLHQLSRTQLVGRPFPEVFAFFSDASNLDALTPPFLHFRILTPMPIELRAGAQLDYLCLAKIPSGRPGARRKLLSSPSFGMTRGSPWWPTFGPHPLPMFRLVRLAFGTLGALLRPRTALVAENLDCGPPESHGPRESGQHGPRRCCEKEASTM